MDKLRNDGFILIKNNTYNNDFNKSLNKFYKNNIVDYIELKNFIDNQYYPKLKHIIKVREKIYYGKFRFSNNNNSSDASTFHADIYNHTNQNIINVYTCLYYFDDAQLEIIPKSHRKDFIIRNNYYDSYNQKIKLNIKANTFVIFHANIHHRGLNFTKNNRRLLQIFDVFLNKQDYYYYKPKLTIVKTYDSLFIKYITNISRNIYTNNNQNLLTYIHYFLVYYDLQYKLFVMSDLSPFEKNNKLISYESGKRVNLIDSYKLKENNINVICNNNIRSCGPGYFYLYCYIFYWLILIIIYLLIIYKK